MTDIEKLKLIAPYAKQIKELEAALSTAEAAKTAMAEALGPFAKLGLEPSPGSVWREVHVSDLRKAAEVLYGLRSEAEGKTP
ncbi:hypothetical protein ABNQ39_20380 [Azospirillum sp. A26]|uniref:hypothetical protein n=1 Tax=Azospirillum sp. A26 TaxID=3160607 RepID=UPI00367027BB